MARLFPKHTLGLYAIALCSDWKVKNNAQGDWTGTSYSESDWNTETPGSATGTSHVGTQYFCKQFNGVSDMAAYEVRLNYCYGVVAYISGMEVFRDNKPDGAVSFTTAATTQYADVNLRGFIRPGSEIAQNGVLAMELHFLSSFTQPNIDFDTFLAVVGSSEKDAKCFPYPYTVDITSDSSYTVNSVTSMYDFNVQSSLLNYWLSSASLIVKMSLNSAFPALINNMMLYPKYANNNPRVGTVEGSMNGSSYSTVIGFSGYDITPKVFSHALGYWGGKACKYYRLTVSAGTTSNLIIYEYTPSICSVQSPPSIVFPQRSYSFYKNVETVHIEPVIFGFTECTVQLALPQGLTLDPDTCIISGTALESRAETTYTITSAVESFSISGTIILAINECGGSVI